MSVIYVRKSRTDAEAERLAQSQDAFRGKEEKLTPAQEARAERMKAALEETKGELEPTTTRTTGVTEAMERDFSGPPAEESKTPTKVRVSRDAGRNLPEIGQTTGRDTRSRTKREMFSGDFTPEGYGLPVAVRAEQPESLFIDEGQTYKPSGRPMATAQAESNPIALGERAALAGIDLERDITNPMLRELRSQGLSDAQIGAFMGGPKYREEVFRRIQQKEVAGPTIEEGDKNIMAQRGAELEEVRRGKKEFADMDLSSEEKRNYINQFGTKPTQSGLSNEQETMNEMRDELKNQNPNMKDEDIEAFISSSEGREDLNRRLTEKLQGTMIAQGNLKQAGRRLRRQGRQGRRLQRDSQILNEPYVTDSNMPVAGSGEKTLPLRDYLKQQLLSPKNRDLSNNFSQMLGFLQLQGGKVGADLMGAAMADLPEMFDSKTGKLKPLAFSGYRAAYGRQTAVGSPKGEFRGSPAQQRVLQRQREMLDDLVDAIADMTATDEGKLAVHNMVSGLTGGKAGTVSQDKLDEIASSRLTQAEENYLTQQFYDERGNPRPPTEEEAQRKEAIAAKKAAFEAQGAGKVAVEDILTAENVTPQERQDLRMRELAFQQKDPESRLGQFADKAGVEEAKRLQQFTTDARGLFGREVQSRSQLTPAEERRFKQFEGLKQQIAAEPERFRYKTEMRPEIETGKFGEIDDESQIREIAHRMMAEKPQTAPNVAGPSDPEAGFTMEELEQQKEGLEGLYGGQKAQEAIDDSSAANSYEMDPNQAAINRNIDQKLREQKATDRYARQEKRRMLPAGMDSIEVDPFTGQAVEEKEEEEKEPASLPSMFEEPMEEEPEAPMEEEPEMPTPTPASQFPQPSAPSLLTPKPETPAPVLSLAELERLEQERLAQGNLEAKALPFTWTKGDELLKSIKDMFYQQGY